MPYLRRVNVKLVLKIKVLICNLKFCFIFAVSKETK
nr:MAG TPA: hypothetical protein [Bacteriophage sp.]